MDSEEFRPRNLSGKEQDSRPKRQVYERPQLGTAIVSLATPSELAI